MNLSAELRYLGMLLENGLVSTRDVVGRLEKISQIEKNRSLVEMSYVLKNATRGTAYATFRGEPLCDCGVWNCLYPYLRRVAADKAGYFGERIHHFNRPASHTLYLQQRKDKAKNEADQRYAKAKKAIDERHRRELKEAEEMK